MSEIVPFISDRAIEAERKSYLYMRFDWHMESADRGETTRELAIAAFFAEMNEAIEDDIA